MADEKDLSTLEQAQPEHEGNISSQTSAQGDEEKAPSDRTTGAGDVEGTPQGDEDKDPNIVDWDGPTDPKNPRNWTNTAKVTTLVLIVWLNFLTPLSSSMFAPGVPDVLRDFHTNSTVLAELVVSVFLIGYAFGPLVVGPASETYGRYWVYATCNVMFLIFTIACAVSGSMAQLIVFRFFAGAFGVCPVTLGGATIADLIPQEKRGVAMALFVMGPLLGPVVGPICGSYLSAAKGWRWNFWIIAIFYALFTIAHALFCKETHHSTILAAKTRRLQKETGNMDLRSKLDDGLSTKERVTRATVRPLKMLFLSPIVGLMALYVAIVYGILYLLYTTFTFVFEEDYGFSSANVGLTYIASGIGMFIGLFAIGATSDRLLKSMAAKNGGELKPEYRLLPLMYTSWLSPVGLFIYGWTAQYHEQWAVPMFGTLLFGIGIMGALMCIQQYLIDAFTVYAASAIAANTVLRSILGGLLPLAGLSMYDALGLGWGNSLLAFIAVALLPIPFIFYYLGERIRKSTQVKL